MHIKSVFFKTVRHVVVLAPAPLSQRGHSRNVLQPTHPSEFIVNRHMFCVRGISHEEKLENLRNVLDEEDHQEKRRKAGHLPSKKEVLEKRFALTRTPVKQQMNFLCL